MEFLTFMAIQFRTLLHIWNMNFLLFFKYKMEATVLLALLSLSPHPLFWDISRFPGFPSNPLFLRRNPWFLRQNPVLPGVLRAVLRMVRGGGGGVVGTLCG